MRDLLRLVAINLAGLAFVSAIVLAPLIAGAVILALLGVPKP